MGVFDLKKNQTTANSEVAECDKQIAALERRRTEVYLNIGRTYADNTTVENAKDTPFADDIAELQKIAQETEFYEKRKLAVQGLRKCEKCGNILVLDSVFCNKCGEKLEELFQTDIVEKKVCSKCGAPYEEDAAFCISCGNMLS